MENNHKCKEDFHVHEVLGSTRVTGCGDECHSHRFATISSGPIPTGCSHVHEVRFCTDSCDKHQHEFKGMSSEAIDVGCGHHVHFAEAFTSSNGTPSHKHKFTVASLIDDPTCE